MSQTAEQVLASALALPADELHELIDQLLGTLPDEVVPAEVPDWHLALLAQRRAAAAATPGVGRPWREVLGDAS